MEPLVDADFANYKERAMSVLMRAQDEKTIDFDVDEWGNGTVWRVGPRAEGGRGVKERTGTQRRATYGFDGRQETFVTKAYSQNRVAGEGTETHQKHGNGNKNSSPLFGTIQNERSRTIQHMCQEISR